jgi:hypothetical protein
MMFEKRSRRPSTMFDSRFRDGSGGDFPLRQFMRCKEEFSGGVVHLFLLVAFIFTLGLFTRTVDNLFSAHGEDLNPLYRWLALGLLVIFTLSVVRRLYYKVLELREIRREMGRLREEMRQPEAED